MFLDGEGTGLLDPGLPPVDSPTKLGFGGPATRHKIGAELAQINPAA